MKIVAIIQARMGSTRLPGKVLRDIDGEPMIDHVIDRIESAKNPDLVVLATSRAREDDALYEHAKARGIQTFRGSEQDVLDRYQMAATACDAEVIVRVTGDCPLIDPDVVDLVIDRFLDGGVDYASNTIKPTYPDGQDTEVMTASALATASEEANLPSDREHVTPYIWRNPDRFALLSVEREHNLSALRWTVDEPEDIGFVREILRFSDTPRPSMDEVLKILEERPELQAMNEQYDRNEGYHTSLADDEDPDGSKG